MVLSCANGDALVYNRYGILEPERGHYRRISVAALDLVFTPLITFDSSGRQSRMGSGYYDHVFQFLKRRQYLLKLRPVDHAYEFRGVTHIKPEPWDIPLDTIGTEARAYHCIH